MRIITNSTEKGTVTYDVEFNSDDHTEAIGYEITYYDHVHHKVERFHYEIDEHCKAIEKFKELEENV